MAGSASSARHEPLLDDELCHVLDRAAAVDQRHQERVDACRGGLAAERIAERHGLGAAHEPLGQSVIARHLLDVALLARRPAHDALAPRVPARRRAQVRDLALLDRDVAEAVLLERRAALVEAVARRGVRVVKAQRAEVQPPPAVGRAAR